MNRVETTQTSEHAAPTLPNVNDTPNQIAYTKLNSNSYKLNGNQNENPRGGRPQNHKKSKGP